MKAETLGFLRHKLQSFYPELVLASIIALLSAWVCSSHFGIIVCAKTFIDAVVSNLFLLNMSGLAGWGLNGAVWYLSSLMIAMLIVYPVLRCVKPIRPAVAAACLLAALMWLTGGDFFRAKATLAGLYIGNMRAVVELFLGAGLYEYARKIRGREALSYFRGGLTCLKAAMLVGVLVYCLHPQTAYAPLVMMALCVIIVISFALSPEYGKWVQNRYVAFLGSASLSVYLSHEFIAWRLNSECFSGMVCSQRVFLYYALALIFSALVHGGGRCIRQASTAWKQSRERKTI